MIMKFIELELVISKEQTHSLIKLTIPLRIN